MHKFDKIKTASDKRLAMEKRGKAVAVDYKPGDVLFLSEKLDGFNTSIDSDGRTYSRSNELGDDMTHHKKLIPFKEMSQRIRDEIHQFFGTEDDFQVFGEFMVTDRIIPYAEDVYDKWYIFDVYNLSKGEYLGPQSAVDFTEHLFATSESFKDMVMPLNVIDEAYTFTTYEDLERYVYNKSQDSIYGAEGTMEGIVAYGRDNGLRAKIVNKEFKETQRTVTTGNGHTKAVQWVNQYLTDARIKKLVKNALVEDVIDPTSKDYFVGQLDTMAGIVWQDILDEADDKPEFKGNDEKNVLNKVEAKTRFIMLEEKNYGIHDDLASSLNELSGGLEL